MNPDRTSLEVERRYVRREMVVAAAISAVLSSGFTWLGFGHQAVVERAAITRDSVPQALGVIFMATLVPSLMAMAKIRRGELPGQTPPVADIARRAVIHSVLGAGGCLIAHLALAPWLVGDDGASLRNLFVFKIVLGAVLGAMAAGIAVNTLLSRVRGAVR